VQHENTGVDPEAYKSSAGYLFSPYDGVRSIAEIVFGGLLDPERLARMDSIHHFDSASPSASEVISALVKNAFTATVAAHADLSDVLQNALADRLMILAVDDNATAEVRAEAWSGVNAVSTHVKGSQSGNAAAIERRIEAFIRDPKQNVPKLKPSGAPAGPPI